MIDTERDSNMKKVFCIIVCSLIAIMSFVSCQKNSEEPEETRDRYGNYDGHYDIVYLSYENGRPPLFSKEELAKLPTDELIERCFSQMYVTIFENVDVDRQEEWKNNPHTKLRKVRDDFGRTFVISEKDIYYEWLILNGVRELERREDAIPCLLEAYRNSDVSDSFGSAKMNGDDYRLMQCLEVVLSQDVYLDRMTDEEKATLYELIEGFHGADRSGISTEGVPVADQSYRFYPYYPVTDE